MITSSHLHFRRYPPIYPNITPRYYIPDSLYTLYRLWRPFLHLFQLTYTMLTIQQIPCKPNVVLLSIILHLPDRLRFDRLIREKLEGETVKRWNLKLCSGEIDPVGWLDVNVLSHQTCSTGRAFPASWIQKYAMFESFLMIRLFRWKHLVSLLLTLSPPKKAPAT